MATEDRQRRGLDISTVLSRTSETINANLGLYLALALPLAGVPAFMANWWQSQYVLGRNFAELIALLSDSNFWTPFAIIMVVSMATRSVLHAALTRATARSLSGQTPGLAESLETGFSLLFPVFLIDLIVGIGALLGCLLLIVPGVILWLCWSMAVPAYVQEKIGPIEALNRSLDLTRGERVTIFWLMVVVTIGLIVLGAVIGFIGGIFGDEGSILRPLVQGLITALSAMISATVVATTYVELRNLKEGGVSSELETVFN